MDENERTWRRRQLDAAMETMGFFSRDCEKLSDSCYRRATWERTRSRVLTLSTAIVATVAGAGGLSELVNHTIVGVIALISAVLGTVALFYANNSVAADKELAKADALKQLSRDIEDWRIVDAKDPTRKLEAVDMLKGVHSQCPVSFNLVRTQRSRLSACSAVSAGPAAIGRAATGRSSRR